MTFPGRALVTGGTGFLGRHLARRLVRDGVEVHVLVRPSARTAVLPEAAIVHAWDGDAAALAEIVARARPGVTFHLASAVRAEHRPDEIAPMIAANVTLGTQLADALCAQGFPHLVNTGTVWQHFSGPDYDPVCLYAATKQAFEDILTFYVRARGLRAVTLKLLDTYGPDDERGKLLGLLREAWRSGRALALSPGEQLVDLTHVEDVVEAFLLAGARVGAQADAGAESFSVVSGRPLPLRAVVAAAERAWGGPVPVAWGARPYRAREVMRPWLDGPRLPGWTPAIGLEDGLRRLMQGSAPG